MIGLPVAHVGGIPIEETLASMIPALLVAYGAASAQLRGRLRRARSSARTMPHAQQGAAQRARAGYTTSNDERALDG